MANIQRGGCMCGATRYEIDMTRAKTGNCHCTDCQKNSGCAFMPFTSVKYGQLTWTNEPQGVASVSAEAKRRFCSKCGTPMTWEGVEYQHHQSVSTGTLDDPSCTRITYEIYTRSRWPGIMPVEGALQFEDGDISAEDIP